MEKTTKTITLMRTRNSEFTRYRSNIKSLFIRRLDDVLIWKGQHENADVLEGYAKQYAAIYDIDIEYELRTATGIRVEFGTITHRKKAI